MYSIYEVEDFNGLDGGTLNLLKGDNELNFLISITPENTQDEVASVWMTGEQIAEMNKLVNK